MSFSRNMHPPAVFQQKHAPTSCRVQIWEDVLESEVWRGVVFHCTISSAAQPHSQRGRYHKVLKHGIVHPCYDNLKISVFTDHDTVSTLTWPGNDCGVGGRTLVLFKGLILGPSTTHLYSCSLLYMLLLNAITWAYKHLSDGTTAVEWTWIIGFCDALHHW